MIYFNLFIKNFIKIRFPRYIEFNFRIMMFIFFYEDFNIKNVMYPFKFSLVDSMIFMEKFFNRFDNKVCYRKAKRSFRRKFF